MQRATVHIGLRRFCDHKTINIKPKTCFVSDLDDEEIFATFYEKIFAEDQPKESGLKI